MAELVAEHWDGLARFVASRVPRSVAPEDVAQEAFVRLWERREQWREGSAKALLFRMAVNASEDERRRAQVRARLGHEAAPATGPTPAEELERRDTAERVRAAIGALPDRRRTVFELIRLHGMSYAEVAAALGLSTQTVANHMSLALRDLRDTLQDLASRPHGSGVGDSDEHEARRNDG